MANALNIILVAILILAAIYAGVKKPNWRYVVIPIVGLLARVLFLPHPGFVTDIGCFKAWADELFRYGLPAYYISDSFGDYPPGYLYILYVIGFIRNVFSIGFHSLTYLVIIKLPAVFFDIAIAVFIYVYGKRFMRPQHSYLLSLLFVLNPAIILISAVWGQVDSVFVFFVLLSLAMLSDKKLLGASLLFALSALIKPQALIFAPVFGWVFIRYIWGDGFKRAHLGKVATCIFAGMLLVVLLTIPFTYRLNFMPIINQYIDTLGSYSFAAVNAYNFYTFFGYNWTPLAPGNFMWGVVSFSLLGAVGILGAVLLSGKDYFRKPNPDLFLNAFIIIFTVFMFSVRMHERYLFPALPLMLFAFIRTRQKWLLFFYGALSITYFINCLTVMRLYFTHNADLSVISTVSVVISAVNLALYVLFIVFFYTQDGKDEIANE